MNVALPSIGDDLHVPVSGLQWTVDIYVLVLASMLMFSGANADRFGRRRTFQAGLSLFTLASLLCGMAPSLSWLLAFRAIQAVGGSMLNPAAMSIIATSFTEGAARARALGIWQAAFGAGMAAGPLLGGLVVGAAGWQAIFWINIPVGMAAVAAAAMFVPESRADRARRPDPVGQVLVIVMLGALTYAIIEGPAAGWQSARITGSFTLAVISFGALLAYEPRRRDPLLDLRLFGSVQFSGAAAAAVFVFAVLGGFLFLSTLYLQDVRGLSPVAAGLRIAPMAVAVTVCAPLAGRLVAKGWTRAAMLIAGSALTLSCAALSTVTAESPGWYLLGAYVLLGIGIGMANEPITYAAVSGMPPAQAGLAGGVNSTSRMIGLVLGVAIVGPLLRAHLRLPMRSGFTAASHPAWLTLVGVGYAVLLVGILATGSLARATAARAAARFGGGAPPGRPERNPQDSVRHPIGVLGLSPPGRTWPDPVGQVHDYMGTEDRHGYH